MKYKITPQWFIFAVCAFIIALIMTQNISVAFTVFAISLMPDVMRLYLSYAKDNPQNLWFKRKIYGWGWTPVTWQGWLVTLIYVGSIMLFSRTVDKESPPSEVFFTFILPLILLTITFIRITLLKGEPPKWQWGR